MIVTLARCRTLRRGGAGFNLFDWCEKNSQCTVKSQRLFAGVRSSTSYYKSGKVRRVPLPPDLLVEVRTRVGRLAPFSATSPGSFTKVVRSRSGIERFHVHQLRHTFGCRWIERGGSLAALQELMGHASVVTTQRYARLSEDMVRREVDRVEARQRANQ